MTFLLLWAVILTPQEPQAPKDPPKVTYEDKGDFRLLVLDLERRFQSRVRFGKGIPSKDVTISVRDAGYFEALDALCRAHKEATYYGGDPEFNRKEPLTVCRGEWVEYPSVYSGHFKLAFVSMMRTAVTKSEGEVNRVDAGLVLFGPPWLSLHWVAGTAVDWSIKDARDSAGRAILEVGGDRHWYEDHAGTDPAVDLGGNSAAYTVRLKNFDLDKGLKTLSGTVKVRAADARIERLPAQAGAVLEIAQGKLVLDSVKKTSNDPKWTQWKFSFTFTPNAPGAPTDLGTLFEHRARFDGLGADWGGTFRFPASGLKFEVEETGLPRDPAWIELRVRASDRTYEIPFQFQDTVFGKGQR